MTGPDPWGNAPGYPPAGGVGGQQFPPYPGNSVPGADPSWGYGASPPTYGVASQPTPLAYGSHPTSYGRPPDVSSWRRIWPLVSLVVAVCGIALAFAPPPVRWVGAVAGVFGIVAAVIGWLRRERARDESVLPVTLGAGLSVLAVVAVIVMGFVFGEPGGSIATSGGPQLDVEIGSYEFTHINQDDGYGDRTVDNHLTVRVTSRAKTTETYTLSIGAFEGDTNNQIRAERDVFDLEAGASQELQLFKLNVSPSRAEALEGATFRVLGVQ